MRAAISSVTKGFAAAGSPTTTELRIEAIGTALKCEAPANVTDYGSLGDRAGTANRTAWMERREAALETQVGQQNLLLVTQLEIPKVLRDMQRGLQGNDSDNELESVTKGERSKTRELAAMRQNLCNPKQAQRRAIRDYMQNAREIAGVEGLDIAVRFTNASKKIHGRLGKMLNLWRVHVMMNEVLQARMSDGPTLARTLRCQALRAIQLSALEENGWNVAQPLFPVVDPLKTPEFGGTPEQWIAVYVYRIAIGELKKTKRGKQDDVRGRVNLP